MKKLIFAVAVLSFVALAAYAAENITVKGTIIDNACSSAHKADLAKFVPTHPKECALMPACQKSGYSIYSDKVLQKFDKASNAKIIEFLKKKDNKLTVTVVAKKVGNELNLISIENQK